MPSDLSATIRRTYHKSYGAKLSLAAIVLRACTRPQDYDRQYLSDLHALCVSVGAADLANQMTASIREAF
jgi:hypothetical protein